ncbi:methionine/alanine import family NSS transporter small subunit [Kocuria sp. KH4]
MTASAIVMLVVAVLTVWGGFVAAVLHLRSVPEETDDDQGFGAEDYPRTT